jgi:hypothetical protein
MSYFLMEKCNKHSGDTEGVPQTPRQDLEVVEVNLWRRRFGGLGGTPEMAVKIPLSKEKICILLAKLGTDNATRSKSNPLAAK